MVSSYCVIIADSVQWRHGYYDSVHVPYILDVEIRHCIISNNIAIAWVKIIGIT